VREAGIISRWIELGRRAPASRLDLAVGRRGVAAVVSVVILPGVSVAVAVSVAVTVSVAMSVSVSMAVPVMAVLVPMMAVAVSRVAGARRLFLTTRVDTGVGALVTARALEGPNGWAPAPDSNRPGARDTKGRPTISDDPSACATASSLATPARHFRQSSFSRPPPVKYGGGRFPESGCNLVTVNERKRNDYASVPEKYRSLVSQLQRSAEVGEILNASGERFHFRLLVGNSGH
jgi:hypothetical protein